MNWFDRTVAWFAPQSGLRRARARAAIAVAQLAYEGARVGRRTAGWVSSGASANAEVAVDLKNLRERSRELIRNNHFAAKAALEFRTKVVGTGITARADERAMNLWRRWQRECSADNLPHFAALQAQVAGTLFESGECLIRRRTRTAGVASGMTVPIQLQVMEPDFLDIGKTFSADANGNYAIQGVEFNSWGQRIAYWLFPQHPGEVVQTGSKAQASQRISASEIIHVRDITSMRPGQVRGVPALAPVMLAMRDLDDWEDSELIRKKTEACLAAIVTNPNGEQGSTAPTITDSSGRTIEQFEPGMIAYGSSGYDIKFNQPSYAGGYGDYKKSRVKDLAIGVGMIYEILSGDLSDVNYSSYRAGLLGFRDRVEAVQWNVMVPMLCDAVWNWFVQAAVDFSGLVPGEYGAEWQPPAFDLLDREAESKADDLMLENGTMSWPQAVQRQGYDPEKQIQEIAAWKPRLEAAGVKFNPKSGAQPNGQDQAAGAAN